MNRSRRSATACRATGLVVLSLLMVSARPATATISLTIADRVDPVPPGGTLTYAIRVNNNGTTGNATGCFNPPPECITAPATCLLPPAQCVGNSFTGYVCEDAANEGANCGVGDPPVPDTDLCVPVSTGVCKGGFNAGFACSLQVDCPGQTFTCVRAFNDGDFCGTGSPPVPDSSLCVANQTGFCASGPNFGRPCKTNAECPPGEGDPTSDLSIITLPIPPGTIFFDAYPGAISDGTTITWEILSEACSGPGGVSGTPPCPVLTAQFIVNTSSPVGSLIENAATVIPPNGAPSMSATIKTTVGTFRLRRLRLSYRPGVEGRDRLAYRTILTLGPGQTIDPSNEAFGIDVVTSTNTITSLGLLPGELPRSGTNQFGFRSRDPGLARVLLRELAPSHYSLRVSARRMSMDLPDDLTATISIVLGDDVLTHVIPLAVKRAGRRYVGLKN